MFPRLGGLSCAMALLLFAGTNGQAAPGRLEADDPLLNLWPGSTTPGKTAGDWIDIYVPSSKEMAKVVLFFPAGYGGILGRAPGADVGESIAWDPSFDYVPGYLTATNPADYASNTCAPGTHQAVWLETPASEAGVFPEIPILIDATTGSEAALGAYKAQFCLPSSSSGSMKIHELDLHVLKLTNPAAKGAYTWRAFVTPYKTGAPYDAGMFELRGTIPMPTVLTLHARYDRKHKRALLTGRMTAAGYDVAGTFVDLFTKRGSDFVYTATARVTKKGTYSLKRRIKKTTRFRMLTSTYDDCAPGSLAPAGCLTDALANILSPVVKVVVPKH